MGAYQPDDPFSIEGVLALSVQGVKVTAWRKVHRGGRVRCNMLLAPLPLQRPQGEFHMGCPCNDKKKPKPKGSGAK